MGAFSQAFLPGTTAAISFVETLRDEKHPHPKNGAFACGTPAGKKRRARVGATGRCRHQLRSLVRRSTQSRSQTMRLGVGRTTPPGPGRIGQRIPAERLYSAGAAIDFPLGSSVCFFSVVPNTSDTGKSPLDTA